MLSRISTVLCRSRTPIINTLATSYETILYGCIPWRDYNLTLPDINKDLFKGIGGRTGIKNLSGGSFTSSPFPVKGIICGVDDRLMICLNCRISKDSNAPILKVWFVVNTGSHLTFLSAETMEALDDSNRNHSPTLIRIQNPKMNHWCYPSHGQFKDANILGMETLCKMNLSIEGMDWANKCWKLVKT